MWKTIKFGEVDIARTSPIEFCFESTDGVLREGQSGFGKVRYAEGSVYTGSLVYTDGQFEKYGYGEQDFTASTMCAGDFCAHGEYYPYKFVGFYDYRMTEWIYGNGVMYFKDRLGEPTAFIKGFFAGCSVIDEWNGDFTEELLLPGYTADMEISPCPHASQHDALESKIRDGVKCDTLLIGDSWFELYEKPYADGVVYGTFKDDTAGKSVVNIGVGGSKFVEWVNYLADLIDYVTFDKVIINLGFNDVHSGQTPDVVVKYAKEFIEIIRKKNKNAKLYALTITPSTHFVKWLPKEKDTNAALKKLYADCGVTVLDSVELFMPNGKYIDGFEDMFVVDGLHLNRAGYELWRKLFVEIL